MPLFPPNQSILVAIETCPPFLPPDVVLGTLPCRLPHGGRVCAHVRATRGARGVLLLTGLPLPSSQSFLPIRDVFFHQDLLCLQKSQAEFPVSIEITSKELKNVSKPHKTPVVCSQPGLAALFDVINLTAYAGLVLPHLGRVHEAQPFTPAPSAAAGAYRSYRARPQPDRRVTTRGMPATTRKSRRMYGWVESIP